MPRTLDRSPAACLETVRLPTVQSSAPFGIGIGKDIIVASVLSVAAGRVRDEIYHPQGRVAGDAALVDKVLED